MVARLWTFAAYSTYEICNHFNSNWFMNCQMKKKKLWWDTPIGLIKFRREKTSIRNWVLVPSVPSVRSYSTQFFWHCVLVRYSHWTNIMQYVKPLYPASLITVTVIFIIMVVGILTANIETKHSPRTCFDFSIQYILILKQRLENFPFRNSICTYIKISIKERKCKTWLL